MTGHMEAAALLLNVGGNVHHETKYGYTALSHACANGHTSTAVMLIDRGSGKLCIELMYGSSLILDFFLLFSILNFSF